MFEYHISRDGKAIALSPMEIEEILVLHTAREALRHVLGKTSHHNSDALAIACRYLFGKDSDNILNSTKLLRTIVRTAGNGTPADSEVWHAAAETCLKNLAKNEQHKRGRRLTLMELKTVEKDIRATREALKSITGAFGSDETECNLVECRLSDNVLLYGVGDAGYQSELDNADDWNDTMRNWMLQILNEDASKPVVFYPHKGEVYILRNAAA